MIDRIRMYIEDFRVHDIEKDFGAHRAGLDTDGAEIWEFKDGNMKFRYVGNRLNISGSLHKYAHGNNYDLFTYGEMVDTLLKIEKKVGVPLERFNISNMEIGVNIPVSDNPEKFIETLALYKTKRFFPMRPMSQSSAIKGYICPMSAYTIKFYDKMYEYFRKEKIKVADRKKYPSNILRYEIALSSKQLKQFGAKNLTADAMLNPVRSAVLIGILKDVMNEIAFNDINVDYSKIPVSTPKALHIKVKDYIFAVTGGYDRYLSYLKEYVGKKEFENERRNKGKLMDFIKPYMLGKYSEELKEKFAETYKLTIDYKKRIRGKV